MVYVLLVVWVQLRRKYPLPNARPAIGNALEFQWELIVETADFPAMWVPWNFPHFWWVERHIPNLSDLVNSPGWALGKIPNNSHMGLECILVLKIRMVWMGNIQKSRFRILLLTHWHMGGMGVSMASQVWNPDFQTVNLWFTRVTWPMLSGGWLAGLASEINQQSNEQATYLWHYHPPCHFLYRMGGVGVPILNHFMGIGGLKWGRTYHFVVICGFYPVLSFLFWRHDHFWAPRPTIL